MYDCRCDERLEPKYDEYDEFTHTLGYCCLLLIDKASSKKVRCLLRGLGFTVFFFNCFSTNMFYFFVPAIHFYFLPFFFWRRRISFFPFLVPFIYYRTTMKREFLSPLNEIEPLNNTVIVPVVNLSRCMCFGPFGGDFL